MATIPSGQKILTSAPEVNTTYGGSASLQALNTWYTMEDISNTVRPYKVYTALLTQDGGDGQQSIISGALVKGITYKIESNDGDYSNVGAPNNNEYTYFVATADAEPTTWGSFGLGYNPGAPVATVLENTIGNIWFTYEGDGTYYISSNGLFSFPSKSCIAYSGTTSDDGGPTVYNVYTGIFDSSFAKLYTSNLQGEPLNSVLGNYLIEIRVYN